MPVPVVALTGVDPHSLSTSVLGLSLELPDVAVVRHVIDPHAQTLVRTVSDVTGLLEHAETALDHACVACALREDVVPTLRRLAATGRWSGLVAALPVGASARSLGAALLTDEPRRLLSLRSVVVTLAGATVVDDLLGDDLLRERGHHSGPDDARGVGEVGCALVEQADVVVVDGGATDVAHGLLAALAAPGTERVTGAEHLDAAILLGERIAPAPPTTRPAPADGVWQLELASPRPFHPDRLLTGIDALGGGRHRSRGRFWLPSRPADRLAWDGSGGQLSIGLDGARLAGRSGIRLLLTGVGAQPAHLHEAFTHLLLREHESWPGPAQSEVDGFEPWLGPIRRAA